MAGPIALLPGAASSAFLRVGATAAASGSPQGDALVLHLGGLVELGFKMATGQVEALKPAGVRFLELTLQTFAGVEDPLVPGARLLEQYQAQAVSALRAALAPGVAPTLSMAGGSLATTFLESGLAAGDSKVMRRLLELLTSPLASWDQLGFLGQYAAWVGVRARVELLQAHAQCAVMAAAAAGAPEGGADEVTASVVRKAHRPFRSLLQQQWQGLLLDHAVLASQHPSVQAAYSASQLMGGGAPAQLRAAVRGVYAAAAPTVLQALAAGLGEGGSSGDGSSSGGSSERGHGLLLDLALMLLQETGGRLAEAVQEAEQQGEGEAAAELAAATADVTGVLRALARLLAPQHLAGSGGSSSSGSSSVGAAPLLDVLAALTAVVQHTLLPLARLDLRAQAAGRHSTAHLPLLQLVTELLQLVAESAPAELLGPAPAATAAMLGGSSNDNGSSSSCPVATALLECCLAAASLAMPFVIVEPASQDASRLGSPGPSGILHIPASPPTLRGSLPGIPLGRQQGPLYVPLTLPGHAAAAAIGSSCSLGSLGSSALRGGFGAATATLGGCSYSQSCSYLSLTTSLLKALQALAQRCPLAALPAVCPSLLSLAVRLVTSAPAGPLLNLAAQHYSSSLLLLAKRLDDTPQQQQPTDLSSVQAAIAFSVIAVADQAVAALPLAVAREVACLAAVASAASSMFGSGPPSIPAATNALRGPAPLPLTAVFPPPHSRAPSSNSLSGLGARSGSGVGLALKRAMAGGSSGGLAGLAASASSPGDHSHSNPSPFAAAAQASGDLDCGYSSGGGEEDAEAEERSARLVCHLAALLCAGAATVPPPAASPSAAAAAGEPLSMAAAREYVLQVLAAAAQPRSPAALRLRVAEALRGGLQESATAAVAAAGGASTAGACSSSSSSGHRQVAWAQSWLLPRLAPLLVSCLHEDLADCSPLEGEVLGAGVEVVKLLLVVPAAVLAGGQGEAGQVAVMKVLAPLLVECVSPPPPAPVTPALRDMAMRLLTTLPSSAAGTAFKAAIGGLPMALKQRLQTALREATAATASSNGPTLAPPPAAHKPAIALKTTFSIRR